MKPILFVDLDESLIKTDITREYLIRFFALHPWKTLELFFSEKFLPERVKAKMVRALEIDPATLPYNAQVLDVIHQAKKETRTVVLATATHEIVAHQIAKHLGVFDAVIATTDTHNCKGAAKLKMMQDFAKGYPFDYVGDSSADLKIFAHAQTPIIVGGLRYPKPHQRIVRCSILGPSLKALRPLQWIKNILVFFPLLMGYPISHLAFFEGIMAFIAFSMIASSISILQDMGNVEKDRHDSLRENNSFTKGDLTIDEGIGLSLSLLIIASLITFLIQPEGTHYEGGLIFLSYILVSFLNLFFCTTHPFSARLCVGALYGLLVIYGYVIWGLSL